MCTDIANGTYFSVQFKNFFWQKHVQYRRQGKSSKDTAIEQERERETGLFIKSHRSKILNCVIIYKLQIYKYKYNSLKFY